jgi:hypothetical protein
VTQGLPAAVQAYGDRWHIWSNMAAYRYPLSSLQTFGSAIHMSCRDRGKVLSITRLELHSAVGTM